MAVEFEIEDALRRLVADGVATREGRIVRVMDFRSASERYARLLQLDDDSAAHALVGEPVRAAS